jgi:hypothetical protein
VDRLLRYRNREIGEAELSLIRELIASRPELVDGDRDPGISDARGRLRMVLEKFFPTI